MTTEDAGDFGIEELAVGASEDAAADEPVELFEAAIDHDVAAEQVFDEDDG